VLFRSTVHNFEVSPSAVSGGTWAAARPTVLSDLRWLGFNMVAWANNHTLDWSHEGLLATCGHLEREGLVHAGAGRNLAEAGLPRYLDTANGRIALIAANSTIRDWHVAGEQRPDVCGRPGVNPLRFKAVHHLLAADLQRLQQIIDQSEVNATRKLSEQEGFSQKCNGEVYVGNVLFAEGEPGTVTRMDEEDAKRVGRSIHEAARQSDVVLVSHHAHEMKGMDKSKPADFIQEFARFCIDEGAHAYIGHGPHILRGIEIYKDRPIFYSLGNFIFQSDTVERQPAEFYNAYGLGQNHTPADAFDAREATASKGLAADRRVFESVVASFEMEDGKLKEVELYPVTLGYGHARSRRGRPEIAGCGDTERILNDLRHLSAPLGTSIGVVEGVGRIEL